MPKLRQLEFCLGSSLSQSAPGYFREVQRDLHGQGHEAWVLLPQVSCHATMLPPLLLMAGGQPLLREEWLRVAVTLSTMLSSEEVGVIFPFAAPSYAQDRAVCNTQQTAGSGCGAGSQ